MDNDIEELTLQCPHCDSEHTFSIEVDRSHVFYHMASNMMEDEPKTKRFRRIFTCPDKKEHFQAIIALVETFGTIINDVQVVPDDIT